MILSGLKTLLETGEQLTTPGLAEIRGGGGLGRQRQPGVERRVDPAGVESVCCAVLGARAVPVELRVAHAERSRRCGRSASASATAAEEVPAWYLETAAEQGARVVADGRELEVEGDGFFLGISLIDEVTPEMDAYRDEIFGPVLSVTRVSTYDEAVGLVNDNPYGNGTAIFTRDGGVARQFQFDAQAGMVGVNVPIPVPVAYYSFGGWKASLFGDRHIYGPEGVDFYTRGKVVTSRWPDPATSKVDLGFPQTRSSGPSEGARPRIAPRIPRASSPCAARCSAGVP